MKTREQNKTKDKAKRDTNERGFSVGYANTWEKTFMPNNFLEINQNFALMW